MSKTPNIPRLRRRSIKVLKKLVKHDGIYASTDDGWSGAFHAWFGRDTAITASLVSSAEQSTKRHPFSDKAYHSLLQLRAWQGYENNPAIGEELGKITHEVRRRTSKNKESADRIRKFSNMWFDDPRDGLLKNWDSVDSTPLWIIGIARWHQKSKAYNTDLLKDVHAALDWCLTNLADNHGLAAFLGADLKPGRKLEGLHNQSWKDNFGAYQYADGSLAEQPIKDVFVNACFWAALMHGADIFRSSDPAYAEQLLTTAVELKRRINNQDNGFLYKDQTLNLHYFAEALDGHNQQLRAVAADIGMCLWAYHGDECIIDGQYIKDIVQRITRSDMLNPQAGIRNYSNLTKSIEYNNGYHRGPETYWPFVSGLIVGGLDHFGYKPEARRVAEAMLQGVSHFKTCIELFQENTPGDFQIWHHPTEKQQSAKNQAWSAAAIYYATAYLG